MVRTGGGHGQLRARHGNEDVVYILHAVVLHDELAVDGVGRHCTWVGDNHVASRTLGMIIQSPYGNRYCNRSM